MNDALMKTLASLSPKEREELSKALGNFSAPHSNIPPKSTTDKSSKPKGAETYRSENGARFVLSILLKAYGERGVQHVIPYEGRAQSTMRTKYYRAVGFVVSEDLLPDGFDMDCLKISFKKLYGTVEYSTTIKERKKYIPTLGLKIVDRVEWKSDVMKFLEDDRKILEYRDNIKLNEEDRVFVANIVEGICTVEALEDTWLVLKK